MGERTVHNLNIFYNKNILRSFLITFHIHKVILKKIITLTHPSRLLPLWEKAYILPIATVAGLPRFFKSPPLSSILKSLLKTPPSSLKEALFGTFCSNLFKFDYSKLCIKFVSLKFVILKVCICQGLANTQGNISFIFMCILF